MFSICVFLFSLCFPPISSTLFPGELGVLTSSGVWVPGGCLCWGSVLKGVFPCRVFDQRLEFKPFKDCLGNVVFSYQLTLDSYFSIAIVTAELQQLTSQMGLQGSSQSLMWFRQHIVIVSSNLFCVIGVGTTPKPGMPSQHIVNCQILCVT